jgi:hypothetical protein
MSAPVQLAVVAAVALAVGGGGGFVAGTALAPAATGAAPQGATDLPAAIQQRRAQGAAGPGGAATGGQVAGRVIAVGDGSITVELVRPGAESAQTVIALVADSTRVVRTTETQISLTEIVEGDQVVVIGQRDATSGAITATNVIVGLSSLRPTR